MAQLRPAALLLLLQGLLLCVELRAEGLIGHGVGALGMVVGVGGHLLLAVGCGHREELSSGCPWDVLALTAVLTKRVALIEHLLCARSHAKACG